MPKKDYQRPKVSEAVSIAAHQLKNPISVLKGYLEVLLSEDWGPLNLKQKEYLDDALENVQRMATLVNHLLDISKIEERRFGLRLEKFSLEDTIQNIIQSFSSWTRASNVEIVFTPDKGIPPIISDPLKIRQVIENIISNALKYKGSGRGKIDITLRKKGKNLLFTCRDNGVGIPGEESKKIFTKFYRSEKAVELDPSGTGLGLYINKAIIELSGGKIWFRRNPERGVTFYFTLPIAPWAKKSKKY